MNFRGFPPGCGNSVADFWGWDAHEARLRCPDVVSGDMQEDEIQGGGHSLYLETFLHLRVMTWQFAKLYEMSDFMPCHYINQYAPGERPHTQPHTQSRTQRIRTHLVDGSYIPKVIEEDCIWRQCYILAVIFAMIFCLLILQDKPCWMYWNSNLLELRTFGLVHT